MKSTVLKNEHPVTVCAGEIKIKPVQRRRLALLALPMCAALVCAVLPAAAQPTLKVNGSTTPGPVAAGQPIKVEYMSGVCAPTEGYLNLDISFNSSDGPQGFTLKMRQDGSYIWDGTYVTRPQDAGNDTVSITADNCSEQMPAAVPLTVVELQDIEVKSAPASSGWSSAYYIPLENYVALKSPKSTDVVTYKADVIPSTATAGTLITWSGATAASDNLTATIAANSTSGPTPVNAQTSACSCTPITNWIFWGNITYNFSRPLDTNDQLNFATRLGVGIPEPTNAGSVIGAYPYLANPSFTNVLALNKVEIIGTLTPSGIGNLLGNIFTFNPQQVTNNGWDYSTLNNSTGPSSGYSGNDANIPQQTTPQDDKIFAIDTPGETTQAPYAAYGGFAGNFTNYIYIGTVKASDAWNWYDHTKAHFQGYTITASPCVANTGNPTLPTTWGDANW